MANFIEVGHSKNVATFEDLISFCIAYGAAYNPANPNITISALQAKRTAAITVIDAVKTAKTALDNATNLRESTFAPCRALATRIVNALAALSVSELTVDDAKTINRKIQGKRAPGGKKVKPVDGPPAGTTGTPDDNSISVSQQSFDALIDHFEKLKQVLAQEPLYTPNEPDLSIAGVTSLLANMQTVNSGVINATTTLSNARIVRDKTLYHKSTGLTYCADEVKMYVKSVFGASSPEFKQVSKLKFKKPKK